MEEHVTLAVEAEGHITHADGTTEKVKIADTLAFGLRLDADGDVTHAANPELWHDGQFKNDSA